ncbi:MAG TPA: phosphonate ABC transporter, permease protein PhnE [Rhodopila sp.]|jgi:phosphonate transport system permease protein|nr:phosphonate ABC transporter, permease protein PhnE [Rhodopila sp.]
MSSWQLLGSFFPPVLAPDYLLALLAPLLQTLEIAAAAMTIAFCVSLPLGICASLRLPGSRAILSLLTALRSIPDLTTAVLCVVMFGVGPGAGMLALAIYYTAVVGKMFADILRTAPPGPLNGLSSTGATRLQTALFGLLPLTSADLLTYGAYEFESAVRASIIVGAVGGGGLGSELVGSLSALDFRSVTTQILMLVVTVSILDQVAVFVRRRPVLLLPLLPIGVVAVVLTAPRLVAVRHALGVFAQMLPPRLGPDDWAELPRLLWETVWMALAGTAGAVLVAVPAALASARGVVTPVWVAWPVRRGMEVLRTVPEVVWGLILITVAGVGPVSGAVALGIHSTGCLAKLFAETLENVPQAPPRALAAIGASRVAVTAYAVVPTAIAPLAVHALFRLEWNLRMATVMGLIGAGGIGQALYDAQQLFFYRQMMAYVVITWVLVALTDQASGWLRRRPN